MAGLFAKKKKDDSNNAASNPNSQPKQRPAPPPNGLGLTNSQMNNMSMGPYSQNNGSNNNLGYNAPTSGTNAHAYQQPPPAPPTAVTGDPKGPMSPTLSHGNVQPLHVQHIQQQQQQQQQQPPQSPAPATPTPGNVQAPPSALTPQLIWAQRRLSGSNPFPRSQHSTSVTSAGTDIFLYGGTQHGVPQGDLFIIDPASLQCQVVSPGGADPPLPKSGHTAVNIGQYILYFGGWDPTTGQCDNSLHVLHTARKEWNRPHLHGQLPTPRHSHSGCSVGTIMYIFGGQVDEYYLGDILAFDMKTITQNPRWEALEPKTESPPARSGHCAAVHDGKIYVFGGADAEYFYNDIWCFDTKALTWTPIPASGYLPSGRHGHSCTIVDGVLYVFGGNSPDGTELNDAYAFRIHERRWYLFQSVGPVASPRGGHSMCTVKDKIFVLGGDSEQIRAEDPALIHYLELSKIRFQDSPSVNVPPRQVSSAKLTPVRQSAGSQSGVETGTGSQQEQELESDPRSPGIPSQEQLSRPDRPDRPARPERPLTQRPASPATFGVGSTTASSNASPQTSMSINPQLGQRPLTSVGPPPPRGASNNFQNGGQTDGQSMTARRQTMKDDYQNAYGGTVDAPVPPPVIGSPVANRRTLHQMPGNSPLIGGETSPTAARFDRRTMSVMPNNTSATGYQEEFNPYAMEAIATPNNGSNRSAPSQDSYVPPPPAPVTNATPQQAATQGVTKQNAPMPGPDSAPAAPGTDRKLTSASPSPSLLQGQTSRSPSPATAGGRIINRSSPTPPPGTPQSSTAVGAANLKHLGSKAGVSQEESEKLHQQMKEKENELVQLRKRENWLVAEVILARKNTNGQPQQERRLSLADLEKEIENQELVGEQLKIAKVLLKVKEELRSAKMSIATQAQAASFKIKEAERVRTGALQEAAYLKAKISSMSNAQQDPGALARIETDRAVDLEKRLTHALAELEMLEVQFAKAQESFQQEKMTRMAAEERSHGSSVLAEQAQLAHTRALTELTSLHSRAAKAEAESRDYAAQLAESQAGFSGHQSQSSGLMQKITDQKQQIEDLQTALEKMQLAYSAANERATRAEHLCDESSIKVEKLETVRAEISGELSRYKGESERLQLKVEELEGRWQISKDEVITLRKLVEDGLGAFNPRGRSQTSAPPERKHDSIAILNNVSKVSELEHELKSLKTLQKSTEASATKSSTDLAEAMIELSKLEQSSMKARAETISLQKLLSEERQAGSELKVELGKVEQELESKMKELEDYEVRTGLLMDVMREKGIIADDVMNQATARGSGDYAASMESRAKEAESRVRKLEHELEDTRSDLRQQMETLDSQRQASDQHSEKTATLLRKLKNDLEATLEERDSMETEFETLREEHSRCKNGAQPMSSGGDGRIQTLQAHWDEERRELGTQLNEHQNRLAEAEMHSADLSQKVISLTERIEEVETLNEAISEELESVQEQSAKIKSKGHAQEMQLKADVERLVNEVHQAQEMVQTKQHELQRALEENEQLEAQLDHTLQSQAAAVTATSGKAGGASAESVAKLETERVELQTQLRKAQETIQILEGDNSVLEARLQDSEKKVMLLLEDMQGSFVDASHPNSPLNSASLSGVQQQLNHQLASVSSSLSPSHRINNGSDRAASGGESPALNGNRLATGGYKHNGRSSSSPHYDNGDFYQYNDVNATESSQQNHQYGSGRGGQHSIGEVNGEDNSGSSTLRDSMDSITRELEMLKVPWNKRAPTSTGSSNGGSSSPLGASGNVGSNRKTPSPSRPGRQQDPSQQQQFYNNGANNNNNNNGGYYRAGGDVYNNGDGYEYGGMDYKSKGMNGGTVNKQHGNNTDTRSFNDRSPSRLKEYEQMIEEIENARRQH
ncbi:Negative regulator of mitotic exit [Lunasporangiospora selenospora]|uniref:Negative regulator of mitotic exit n=1 Tax=Lunasporangiospora selenospora TaxID=979761 RepID=A0A9P6G0F6_9FUNG|nr:Negative regulator of mitotic exit [Lunasporangiospora selenospora]